VLTVGGASSLAAGCGANDYGFPDWVGARAPTPRGNDGKRDITNFQNNISISKMWDHSFIHSVIHLRRASSKSEVQQAELFPKATNKSMASTKTAAMILPTAGAVASHRNNVVLNRRDQGMTSISFTSFSDDDDDDDDDDSATNMVPHVPTGCQHEHDFQDVDPSSFDETSKKDETVWPFLTKKAESPKKTVKVISSPMSFRACHMWRLTPVAPASLDRLHLTCDAHSHQNRQILIPRRP
jgi:hypothetical protein